VPQKRPEPAAVPDLGPGGRRKGGGKDNGAEGETTIEALHRRIVPQIHSRRRLAMADCQYAANGTDCVKLRAGLAVRVLYRADSGAQSRSGVVCPA
jgi:hypothetical protein